MIKIIIRNEVGILDNQINIYKCGLGNGYGAIDYKGDIYTCQEIVTERNNNDLFKIGNIYSGIDFEKIEKFRSLIVNTIPI
jgi:radical SAM protein with 4Fe4S-binding SPASM domain